MMLADPQNLKVLIFLCTKFRLGRSRNPCQLLKSFGSYPMSTALAGKRASHYVTVASTFKDRFTKNGFAHLYNKNDIC